MLYISGPGRPASSAGQLWVFITRGCGGRGVQRMGVALYDKLVYNIIQITTPCLGTGSAPWKGPKGL